MQSSPKRCRKWRLNSSSSRTTIAPIESCVLPRKKTADKETSLSFFLETIFPFLLAGCGMVGAGILFDIAQEWSFFKRIPQAIMLLPALLGLKGNVEMTLASRLSTQAPGCGMVGAGILFDIAQEWSFFKRIPQAIMLLPALLGLKGNANLGEMAARHQQIHIACSNLALIQAQSIIVSLFAAIAAIIAYGIETGKWQPENSVLLCLTSVATASMTSLLLGMIMFGVVIVASRIGLNPDNITAPIAASLGDITALIIMISVGTILLRVQHQFEVECVALGVWSVASILFVWIASKDKSTANVLKNGWYPIFTAMLISSSAGRILKTTVSVFPAVAAFQPVINGAGGNLVAIQASRISTELHKFGKFGTLPDNPLSHFTSPLWSFFAKGSEAQVARILVLLVLPGHAVFMTIIFVSIRSAPVSIPFITAYLTVALVQVIVLLYLCQLMVRAMWRCKVDPDNSAIPILTALGDLLGTALLAAAFICLNRLSAVNINEHPT
uniref:Divalent cation transporter n=1 Tax=Ascaris lumbricoides TaxID=6252 RepID=A0A0M3I8V2_ASCLU